MLSRTKSLILLSVVIQQMFIFATRPPILANDDEEQSLKNKQDRLLPGPGGHCLLQDPEHVGLLDYVKGVNDDEEEATPMRHDEGAAVSEIVKQGLRRHLWLRKPLVCPSLYTFLAAAQYLSSSAKR
jgi:hypothetical protein